MTDDEKPSSILSNSKVEVKDVDFHSYLSSHSVVSIGNVEIPITGRKMRPLTKMRYKEEELGVKSQGITLPLEVEQRPRFARLGCTKGQFSKVSKASMTLLRWPRKEDDGDTSPLTYGSMRRRDKPKARSYSHDHTRD